MSARHALYFAPDDNSELAHFGQTILGRSATEPRKADATSTFTNPSRWHALTRSPAHYGFHATLKAPFELQQNKTLDNLIESVESFAGRQSAIPLTGLAPRNLSGFAALTLSQQSSALATLAQSVVETFEPFRQALSEADIKRRKSQSLTTRQITLLERFGYPYVAEEFRFHMTLSSALEEADNDYVRWLNEQYQRLVRAEPVLSQIAIFTQANRQSAFVRVAAYPFPQQPKETP